MTDYGNQSDYESIAHTSSTIRTQKYKKNTRYGKCTRSKRSNSKRSRTLSTFEPNLSMSRSRSGSRPRSSSLSSEAMKSYTSRKIEESLQR